MQIPITMPQLGESIAEATIVNFLVQPGDQVEADQNLIEVETNKATMTVTSPCNGRLMKFTAQLHESYPVDCSLGYIEATAAEVARLGLDTPPPKSNDNGHELVPKPETVTSRSRVQPTIRGLP
ncbi:MAG TPA: lipoyl domain-containing protein, partial [Candidatus Angelobacter sp.]|nr:lipoyl domain-containing protein [Candidatus Angelobacter sp.]